MKKIKSLTFQLLILISLLLIPACKKTASEPEEKDNRLRSLESLQKADDFPLYTMTIYGSYGFEDLLKPSAASVTLMNQQPAFGQKDDDKGCTCFAAMGAGMVFGRNFDWDGNPSMLLFTHPPGGYASVSLVDLIYLGYGKGSSLETIEQRQNLMRGPLMPIDGMNEKGLAIGMMALSSARPPYDPQKKSLYDLQVIRLVLDYAAGVDEAVELMKKYNILFSTASGAPPLHYLIADATGKSAVIEFVDGRMVVLSNTQAWQISTNFTISQSNASQSPENTACWRYNLGHKTLRNKAGKFTREDAMQLLSDVSQGSTMWSVVYDLQTKDIHIAMGRKYDQVREFNLVP